MIINLSAPDTVTLLRAKGARMKLEPTPESHPIFGARAPLVLTLELDTGRTVKLVLDQDGTFRAQTTLA